MNNVLLEFVDKTRRLVREHCSTFAELHERLEEIRCEYSALHRMAFGVDLVREGSGRMVAGLGDGEWILMFHPADEEADPIYSVGDIKLEGSVPVYFGDVSLMSRKFLVSRADALGALEAWFVDGTISDSIKWTNEIF